MKLGFHALTQLTSSTVKAIGCASNHAAIKVELQYSAVKVAHEAVPYLMLLAVVELGGLDLGP